MNGGGGAAKSKTVRTREGGRASSRKFLERMVEWLERRVGQLALLAQSADDAAKARYVAWCAANPAPCAS